MFFRFLFPILLTRPDQRSVEVIKVEDHRDSAALSSEQRHTVGGKIWLDGNQYITLGGRNELQGSLVEFGKILQLEGLDPRFLRKRGPRPAMLDGANDGGIGEVTGSKR